MNDNTTMPGMPSMPGPEVQPGQPVERAPVAAPVQPVERAPLTVPSHEHVVNKELPTINEAGVTDSDVKVPKLPPNGILVIAKGKAFFGQRRIAPGEKVLLDGPHQFGAWQECVDPDWEMQRLDHFKKKKAKR